MEILKDKVVKTRISHNCFCCGRKFDKGSMMWHQVNVYEGFLNSNHTCVTCKILIREYPTIFMEYGIIEQYGILYHIKERGLNETPEEMLENLKNEMKK